jgi:hypothetical protein
VGQLASFYSKEKAGSQSQIIEDARRALEAASNRSAQSAMLPTGSRSLADIWARASAASAGQESISSSSVPAIVEGPAITPAPAMTAIPTEKRIEKRIETPNSQGEKYTGLIPALLRNKDSAPKEEVSWRPGTISYVTAPAPAPSVAAAPAPTPSNYATKPRTATVTPSAPAAAENEWLTVPKLLSVLKESQTVAQREWAAECLAGADCSAHPEVISAVASVAKADHSAIVRIACIHTLDKVHARGPEVIKALTALKNDPDPKVQKEAAQAMSHLTGSGAPSGVQPVSATTSSHPR